MKITAIKQQVKRPDRYSVFVDGAYAFSFHDIEIINLKLVVGQEISLEQLAELKSDAVVSKAYNQALNLLSRRLRSNWEMADYLKRKGYEPEQIETILNKLSNFGYLDDEKFAEAWVNDRRAFKSVSKRRLIQELRAKRVKSEVIDKVLMDDETDELEVLKSLVAKKRRLSKYQDELKLMQYLSRQGFGYDDIKSALKAEDD